nr:alkaline phosphatase [Crocosphaera sp.]
TGRFGEEGIREDGRNLIEEAQEDGYTVVYTLEELANLPSDTDKVLGIFAAEDTYNDTTEANLVEEGFVDEEGNLILYGQPGNENPPTVAQMLETTLGLDKFVNAEDGFMVVLEEEGSDNFPNNNNGAGTIEATLRADAAIGVAQDFVNNVDPNTLVLTAADSDAGGLEVDDVSGDTVGSVSVQGPFDTPVPRDGTTGNDTAPFVTGQPDANGDIFEFGIAYASTTDVAGSIVSKAYGLNSDLLGNTVDNTDMYRIMYETLFGVAPEDVERPEAVAFGSAEDDLFDTVISESDFVGAANQMLFAGSGNDYVDVSQTPDAFNRIDLGSGDDLFFAGSGDRVLAGSGDDILFLGSGGDNVVTGGRGSDQFWLVTDSEDLPAMANTITDFTIDEDVIGFGATDLDFDQLSLSQEGNNTVINALGQDLAVLSNIQATDLSASDFVFA